MSAEIFDMKLYKKALKLAKKGKSLKIKPQSNVEYEGNIMVSNIKDLEEIKRRKIDPEKEIKILKEEGLELLNERNELEDRNKEFEKENAVLERKIERAKECMKKLLFIINSDPANYNCKGLIQDAEDFIYNRTCNIRKSGNHCITNEPCIMCDK